MVLVCITPDLTRDELTDCLESFMEEARHLTRRGRVGTLNPRYEDLHDTISALVEAIRTAPLVLLGTE